MSGSSRNYRNGSPRRSPIRLIIRYVWRFAVDDGAGDTRCPVNEVCAALGTEFRACQIVCFAKSANNIRTSSRGMERCTISHCLDNTGHAVLDVSFGSPAVSAKLRWARIYRFTIWTRPFHLDDNTLSHIFTSSLSISYVLCLLQCQYNRYIELSAP